MNEDSPVLLWRMEQIEEGLVLWAKEPIVLNFDPSGTHLFSVLEQTRSYAKRFSELSAAIRSLVGESKIVPAAIVARSLIETIGMGCLFLHDVSHLLHRGDRNEFDERVQQFIVGSVQHSVRPVHVMDAVRHLKKVDEEYLGYLDRKYGIFTEVVRNGTLDDSADVSKFYERVSLTSTYESLSEVVHPNGIGTFLVYPVTSGPNEARDRALEQFRRWSLTSVWYGRFLLSALDSNRDLPERFREAFLTST